MCLSVYLSVNRVLQHLKRPKVKCMFTKLFYIIYCQKLLFLILLRKANRNKYNYFVVHLELLIKFHSIKILDKKF